MKTDSIPLKRVGKVLFSSVDKKRDEAELLVALCNYTDVYYRDVISPDIEFMEGTATPNEVATFALMRGDVLITKDSESADDIGVPAFVDFSSTEVLCGYHLAQIRPDPSCMEGKYLFWWMASDVMREELSSRANGITRFGLKLNAIASAPVRVPPPHEQRAIADFLDRETARIDDLVSSKVALVSLLDERMKALVDEWVSELFAEFREVRFRRWMERIEQGWSPQCDAFAASPGEWGVLKTSAVSSGKFIGSENKRLPEGILPDHRWQVRDGDLLITRGSGSANKVGRAAVAATDGALLTLSDLTYRVRLCRGILPEFVSTVLSSTQCRDALKASIRTDAGQTLKVRGDDLKEVVLPRVPPAEQEGRWRSLQTALDRYSASRDALNRQLSLISERRQALVTAAVTGQLDIPVAA